MRTKTIIIGAILTMIATAALMAQPGGRGPGNGMHGPGAGLWEGLLADFDADQNGEITLEELGNAQTTFNHLDRDGDGVLTEADMSRHGFRHERMRMRRGFGGGLLLHRADSDDDRAITSVEWQDLVDQVDADGNGTIDAAEIAALAPGRPDHAHPPEHVEHLTRMLDRNDNGAVDTDDLWEIFNALDADSNGVVEGEEVRTHGQRRRSGRP